MSIPEGQLYTDKIRELGEIAEHLPDEYTGTFVAEGSIPFGAAVARGSAPEKAKLISSATDEFLGVAAWSYEASDYDNKKYNTNDPCGVRRKAIVVVSVEEAVQPGDKVRVRHTAETGKPAGVFCTTAVAGKTALVKDAEFKSSTDGSGSAVLWVSGPFSLVADA
ncbi:MAG: hypothetical protein FWH53_00800 [Leptospirales bacterium]|nr:hypothetical protein [Leptospirales bacterium]